MANKGAILVLALVGIVGIFLLRKGGRKPPCGNAGDVDGDGYVTQKDAELVKQYLVGAVMLSSEQLQRADVNGDGRVSIIDALLIAQYVDGEGDTFPVCAVSIPEAY